LLQLLVDPGTADIFVHDDPAFVDFFAFIVPLEVLYTTIAELLYKDTEGIGPGLEQATVSTVDGPDQVPPPLVLREI